MLKLVYMKHIVVAYDNNRTIGREGALPWERQMPADMRHFKELTIGKTIIMGRKTFESIGRPLPERQNVVVSRMASLALDGVHVVHSLDEAYDLAPSDAYVIGGAEIYTSSLGDIDIIHATEIEANVDGDVKFPNLKESDWVEIDRIEHAADSKNLFDYSFVTFSRK